MIDLFSDIIQKASEKGTEFSEIQLGQFSNTEISFSEGKKKFSKGSFRFDINLTIWKDGKVGRSSTTSISNLAISKLVENAIESTETNIDTSLDQFQWKIHNSIRKNGYHDDNDVIDSPLTTKDKLDVIKTIYKTINTQSNKLYSTIQYFDKDGMYFFGNSEGYLIKNRISDYIIEVSNHFHYAKKKIKHSYYLCGRLSEKEDIISICKSHTAKKTQRLLDSKILAPVPKKKMNVVFDGEITGNMIHELCHGLDGDFAVTSSPWKKKLNKIIVSKLLTVKDIPNVANLQNLPVIKYDCEGFKTKKNTLIEKGKLVNFITDSNTANLLRCSNTHNSRMSSFDIPSFPSSTNLAVSIGDYGIHELISEAGIGLYCQGISEIKINWDKEKIKIVPETSNIISKGESVKEAQVKVEINYSIDDFMRALKMIGKKPIASTILCTKGGGIVCGAISPPMLFERLTVQN